MYMQFIQSPLHFPQKKIEFISFGSIDSKTQKTLLYLTVYVGLRLARFKWLIRSSK